MRKPVSPELLHDTHWKRYSEDLDDLYKLPRTQIAWNWVRDIRPRMVLDIGCGPGHLAKLIKNCFPQTVVYGVDFSESAIAKAKEVLDCSWKLNIDLQDIPVQRHHYDVILCTEVLEHVYDVPHVLGEINRLLRPSGKVLISVPNLAYWRYRLQLIVGVMPHPEIFSREHIHAFTLGSLKKSLYEASLFPIRWWGHGNRLPLLSNKFPTLFSSTLFVEGAKLTK